MRILITGGGSGGHVSPALAVIERLRTLHPSPELLYVGGTLTMEGSQGPSIEEQLVKPTGITYVAIRAGKLPRQAFNFSTIKRLWGVLPGFWGAWRVLRKFKPDVVFSTGGYVTLPVTIVASLMRVPVVIHEQTAAIGLTNNIASRFARKVAITFPSSRKYFPSSKTILTGNPLRQTVLSPALSHLDDTDLGRWLAAGDLPVLYITGGGLGSHVINLTVSSALEKLLMSYRIVHQCGNHTEFQDYEAVVKKALELPDLLRRRYWPAKSFTSEEVGLLYARSALVVARAGANTVLEVASWGLPALFIPIPWVTHNEQEKNARVLEELGAARILPEKDLTPERLIAELRRMFEGLATLKRGGVQAKNMVARDADAQLVQLIMAVADKG
jgi:UDP-N-acetylglucosamine--N-acetylmuramyl-(pentapeptide) pyrophosphoryl-undecaprenol N-acetylglucosamine transferase